MNPVHTFTSYFCKIHYNSIFPSNPTFFQVVSSLQVLWPKVCMHFLSLHAYYMPHPTNPPWLDHHWRVNKT